jgi:hypothetical protein
MRERPFGKRNGAPGSASNRDELISTADAVLSDFRKIVRILNETAELVVGSDEEFATQLVNTRLVAERGLRLSRVLVRMTRV